MAGKYQAYPEYKDSGVEWLGDVPVDWRLIRLKFMAKIKNGQDYKTIEVEQGYPVIGSGGQFTFASEYMYDEESVLLGRKGTIDKPLYINEPFWTVDTMYYTEVGCDFDAKYLFYLALTIQFKRYATNTALPSMTQENLGNYVFSIPDQGDDRKKIANFLDHETTKIDTLIEKQQQLIKLLKEKRQAVISHAVTKGLDPNVPMRDSRVEWFDCVPVHWRVFELKFAAEKGRKKFTDGDWVESPFITDSGVRLLQTGNVGIGEFKEKGFRYISEASFSVLNCTEVEPRDVLICRLDGPVGRACLAPDLGVKTITSVDNAILKPSGEFDARYIVYLASSAPWLNWIQDLCRVGGGFRLRISRTMLGEQRVPVAPLKEQIKIADELDNHSKLSIDCIKKCEKNITLLKERRTALISAAVTGKIDVRNWKAPEAVGQGG